MLNSPLNNLHPGEERLIVIFNSSDKSSGGQDAVLSNENKPNVIVHGLKSCFPDDGAWSLTQKNRFPLRPPYQRMAHFIFFITGAVK